MKWRIVCQGESFDLSLGPQLPSSYKKRVVVESSGDESRTSLTLRRSLSSWQVLEARSGGLSFWRNHDRSSLLMRPDPSGLWHGQARFTQLSQPCAFTYGLAIPEVLASHAGDDEAMNSLLSPLTGKVIAVHCAVGEQVAEGDPLVTIEAMKMENTLSAPRAAQVSELAVAVGDSVHSHDLLLCFASAPSGS